MSCLKVISTVYMHTLMCDVCATLQESFSTLKSEIFSSVYIMFLQDYKYLLLQGMAPTHCI
jgi:hypothetical protein